MKSVWYVVRAESSLKGYVCYILYSPAGGRMYIGGIFIPDEEIQLSLGLPPDVITNSILRTPYSVPNVIVHTSC